ncbi:MAG: hypothetical protein AAF798_22965 [Bacteroidota bacterium]
MKEFNINDTWKVSGQEADQYYAAIKNQVMEMARQRSQGILDRIIRFGRWELISGAIVWCILLVMAWSDFNSFVVLAILGAVTFAFSGRLYFSMLQNIRQVNSLHTKEAIKQYISILSSYHKKVANYVTWGTFVGFFGGLAAGLISDMEDLWEKLTNWMFWGIILVALVLLYFLGRFLKSAYLHYSIVKFIDELREVLEGLGVEELRS